jgi:hypothetical protein
VLFLTDRHFDYTADALYLGLSRVLGNENVVEYPYKPGFHEAAEVPWYLISRPGRPYSREEIFDLLGDRYFDLACLASFRQESLEACADLARHASLPPMVFVDGSDDTTIRHELVTRFRIGIYFKRDYVWRMGHAWKDRWALAWRFHGDRALFKRTFPLPLSLVMETLPQCGNVPRTIDVSYRGRGSHPRRAKAVAILSGMDGIRFSGGVYASPGDRPYKLKAGAVERAWSKVVDQRTTGVSQEQIKEAPSAYYRELAGSKIALALRGGGRTASLRYFEIVGMGAMLLSDAPETLIPNDFVDRRQAVYCRPDLMDLEKLVRHYLNETAEREAIAKEAFAHLLKYHTCERRAEYFLDVARHVL